MKALFIDGPQQLRVDELNEDVFPKGECRVAVKLAGVCRTDLELAKGYMGFAGVPGHEFVGIVTQGPESLAGRRVVGEINVPCDTGRYAQPGYDPRHDPDRTVLGILGRSGAFAEELALPAENLWVVPDSIHDEEAVFTEPLAAALEIFEQLHVPPEQHVLVIGDGKLGLLIAQVFALHGCRTSLRGRHEKKLALARRWGVQTMLDGESDETPGGYPLVVEATGSPGGFETALGCVRPRGTIVLKSTYAPDELPALDAAKLVVDEITLLGSRCGRFAPALRMLAQGKIDVRGLIDYRLPFERVTEAFERASQKGVLKVLVSMA